MDDKIDYSALAMGLAGAAGGKTLAESDLANGLLAKVMSNRAAKAGRVDYRVPVYAGADFDLTHGSGEAVMASRISRMLKNHGIGSYYVNSNHPLAKHELPHISEYGPGKRTPWIQRHVYDNQELWDPSNVINGGRVWSDKIVTINGKPESIHDALVKRMTSAGVSEEAAVNAIRSGRFDGFRPGELLDTFKTVGKQGIKDIVSGKMEIMPESKFFAKAHSGHLPYMMTGEAGMDYSSLFGETGAPRAIGENAIPFSDAATRNLAFDTQFQANYRSAHDKLIPGVGMYDPGFGRRSAFARKWKYNAPKWLGGGEKQDYLNALSRIASEQHLDPTKFVTPESKYMLISTGAAGANAAEKLRLAAKAFENDPNVKILVQYGKEGALPASAGLDLYTNNGIKEEIARLQEKMPNRILGFARDDDYGLLARNVDLHGSYGGSSSITEALANTNPTVAMTDTILNTGNNNYGTARRGFKQVNSGATALGKLVREGADPVKTIVNTRDGGGQNLRDTIKGMGLEGADYGKIEQEAVKNLQDAMYRSKDKFDKDAVRAANRMLREQRGRNKSFIDTVKRMIVNKIDADDVAKLGKRTGPSGRALASLSRALFKTPAGRRFAAPAAILGALGLGGTTYGVNKWLNSRKPASKSTEFVDSVKKMLGIK